MCSWYKPEAPVPHPLFCSTPLHRLLHALHHLHLRPGYAAAAPLLLGVIIAASIACAAAQHLFWSDLEIQVAASLSLLLGSSVATSLLSTKQSSSSDQAPGRWSSFPLSILVAFVFSIVSYLELELIGFFCVVNACLQGSVCLCSVLICLVVLVSSFSWLVILGWCLMVWVLSRFRLVRLVLICLTCAVWFGYMRFASAWFNMIVLFSLCRCCGCCN